MSPEAIERERAARSVMPRRWIFDQYWNEVADAKNVLPDTPALWLISIECEIRELTGGHLVEVDRQGAAELIVKGTHRLATADEIQAHLERRAVLEGVVIAGADRTKGMHAEVRS